jgi:hypothetical protein
MRYACGNAGIRDIEASFSTARFGLDTRPSFRRYLSLEHCLLLVYDAILPAGMARSAKSQTLSNTEGVTVYPTA